MLKILFIDRQSTDKRELLGMANRSGLRLLALVSEAMFIEVLLDEHQGHMPAILWGNEGDICGPMQAR